MLAVEIGYGLSYYPCHYDNHAVELNKEMKVVFCGTWVGTKFQLDNVKPQDFDQCGKCLKPGRECSIGHSSRARNIAGVWKIVHKRQDTNHSRLWVQRDNQPFAFTAFPGSAYFSLCQKLKISEYIRLRGWLKDQVELKFMRRCVRVTKYPKRTS